MDTLLSYWPARVLAANGHILLHLLGALAVGIAVGYERTYHGRAAGMRTYALVCIASTALTVMSGYPSHWYGGMSQNPAISDPTRIIQGIMTGIGFLGAGVIMKEGFTIRGLSTAASIWMTAAIGVLIGVGFHSAALLAAVLCISVMSGFRSLEAILPHQLSLHLSLVYPRDKMPSEDTIRQLVQHHGFEISDWAFQLGDEGRRFEYQLVLQASADRKPNELAQDLSASADIVEFRLAPSRN